MAPIRLRLKAPFYVGIGFVSHLPTTADAAILSNVVLAGRSTGESFPSAK
jgi:hypothetical protein